MSTGCWRSSRMARREDEGGWAELRSVGDAVSGRSLAACGQGLWPVARNAVEGPRGHGDENERCSVSDSSCASQERQQDYRSWKPRVVCFFPQRGTEQWPRRAEGLCPTPCPRDPAPQHCGGSSPGRPALQRQTPCSGASPVQPGSPRRRLGRELSEAAAGLGVAVPPAGSSCLGPPHTGVLAAQASPSVCNSRQSSRPSGPALRCPPVCWVSRAQFLKHTGKGWHVS